MTLKYKVNGKEVVKHNIIQFWQGFTTTRYRFANGQVHEVEKIDQFYVIPTYTSYNEFIENDYCLYFKEIEKTLCGVNAVNYLKYGSES